jgi:hypothetical protein
MQFNFDKPNLVQKLAILFLSIFKHIIVGPIFLDSDHAPKFLSLLLNPEAPRAVATILLGLTSSMVGGFDSVSVMTPRASLIYFGS